MKSLSLENIVNQGKNLFNKGKQNIGKKVILPAMMIAAGAVPTQAQLASLSVDTDPTIGLGSEEVTDLTQFGAMFYALGNGDVGFRIMYDPEHDGIANPEFTEMRYQVHLNPGDDILSDGFSTVPTGDINMTNRSPPTNMIGTPAGIQNLTEYLGWIINSDVSIDVNNRGSPVTNYWMKEGYTLTQNQLIEQFVNDSNGLYSTPLTTLNMFSGVRPQSFNGGIDWEVVWKDLNGSSGNIDVEKREIQLDNSAGVNYSIVLQEAGFGLYQGAFTMQSANVGTFLDIDRQAPKVLFNSEIINSVFPLLSGKILSRFSVSPGYDSNSEDFMTGDFDPNKEIGYAPLDANGTGTLENIDVENPVANEKKSFGSIKAMWSNNHGRY